MTTVTKSAASSPATQPRRTNVRIGGKPDAGDADGGGPHGALELSGVMNMKNIHKFVIDLNKRAAAKQQGLSIDSVPGSYEPGDAHSNTGGIIAFAGLPNQELEKSISESPFMGEPQTYDFAFRVQGLEFHWAFVSAFTLLFIA